MSWRTRPWPTARADKLLAQEEVWIRKGVEARRTRSVGRVARLVKLREQRQQRRDQLGQVRLSKWTPACPPARSSPSCKEVSACATATAR